jgi:tRNA-dihydrouridine synthase B
MSEWKIGGVVIPNRTVLGPMAGVTDRAFRVLCKEQGVGLLYTEMVSAKAITYRNQNTRLLTVTDPSEHPVALQLFGSDPETVAEGAAMIEDDTFDFFDLNMGCPVPKVVNNQEGSALMKDPKRAAEIVAALTKRVRKPVTVKIRKGFDEAHINAPEFAEAMEQAGASAIAVHARTREQYYSGRADWEIIRRVKERVSVPVIGNGDVTNGPDAKRMMEETGCDAVMLARAARGNPWIFREINTYLETGEVPARPSVQEIGEMILRHARLMIEWKGEYTGLREMRKQVAWYTAGMHGAAKLRKQACEITTFEELEALVGKLIECGA